MKTKNLKLTQIKRNTSKFQFRHKEFVESQVLWLVENWNDSIADPLDVWVSEGEYYLLSGHHRLEAATRLKKTTFSCRIHECNLESAQMLALVSNANRLEYSLFEKSRCLEFLIDSQHLSFELASQKLADVSVWLAKRIYCLKHLRGTSWEEQIDTLKIAPQAFEVGLFCANTPLTKPELESLFRVITVNGISGNHLVQFLKDIRDWKDKEKDSVKPAAEQQTLFDLESFGTNIVASVNKRAAKKDLAAQTWWLYTLVQREENDVPTQLAESLLPLLRQLYAKAIDSENEEEEPKRSQPTKAKSKSQLKKEFENLQN